MPLIKIRKLKQGEIEGRGKLNLATGNIEEAIRDRYYYGNYTAMGHFQLAKEMAPYLQNEQIVVLNPGRTVGL